MANIRLIKRRIKSAKNISQITKAMELVAASKMKKAQAQAMAGKLYAQKIYSMVIQLAHRTDFTAHPLLLRPDKPSGQELVIVISTNKGLCGGLNSNLFRFLVSQYSHFAHLEFISLGNKSSEFLARNGGQISADFSGIVPFVNAVPALTELITKEFLTMKYDRVILVYNEFISALRQLPKRKTILPLSLEIAPEMSQTETTQFLIEPSVAEVFDSLLPHYLENQIRDAILQAEASEHSARMIAMHNATDNAISLTEELFLLYNKARQEKITSEISDIVTARAVVEE